MRHAFLAPLILLASCGPSADDQLIEMAKRQIAARLPATPAAEFRNVHVGGSDYAKRVGLACGEVIVPTHGWRRFWFNRTLGAGVIDFDIGDFDADDVSRNPQIQPIYEDNRRMFDEQWNDDCSAAHS